MEEAVRTIGTQNGLLGACLALCLGVIAFLYLELKKTHRVHGKQIEELMGDRLDEAKTLVPALNASTRAIETAERASSQMTVILSDLTKGFTALVSKVDERDARTNDVYSILERRFDALSRDVETALRGAR